MMFTGLVDHCGRIEEVTLLPVGLRIELSTQFKDLVLGESIAVEGICLTITQIEGERFYCELSPETLSLTTAKNFSVGQSVNLERALTLNTPLGGHFVTGHIDGQIGVKKVELKKTFWQVEFEGLTPEMLMYVVPKGSVTINGVSLTVNEVSEKGFSVMLIPHTLERTSLKLLKTTDNVNVEWDYFGRYIVNYLNKLKGKSDERSIA